jgi:hypothetical protein
MGGTPDGVPLCAANEKVTVTVKSWENTLVDDDSDVEKVYLECYVCATTGGCTDDLVSNADDVLGSFYALSSSDEYF